MNCDICVGACCEAFAVKESDLRLPDADTLHWFGLHGVKRDGWITLECRCTKLSPRGRCTIYDDRPQVCRDFRPGGPECLEFVRARRLPAEYAEIRHAGDPPLEALYG